MGQLVPALAVSSEAAQQADWQQEWDQTLALANQEGTVVIASPPGTVYRDALTAFNQSYPDIKIEYSPFAGRDFAPRILAERQGGQYLWDLYVGGTSTANVDLKPQGVFDPIQPALIRPEVLDDTKWLGGLDAGFYDNEHLYTFAFQGAASYPAYVNRDVVPESELSQVEQLVDPQWDGKVIWQDPTVNGSGGSTGGHLLMALGEDWLRQVYANHPVITQDARQQVESLVRGQYPIAIGVDTGQLVDLQNQGLGQNIHPLAPDTVAGARLSPGFGAVSLINRAPHPNAAKVYLNWLLGPDGQRAWATNLGQCSLRTDVDACPDISKLNPNQHYLPSVNREDSQHFQDESTAIAKEVIK